MFQPNRELEHKGLILSHTNCTEGRHLKIQAINAGERDLFLSKGLQVCIISSAAVDLKDHSVIVNSQEVRILSEPQREVRAAKKCPFDLHNFEGSEKERSQ